MFYLIVVPAKDGRSIDEKFVTDSLDGLGEKYSFFSVEVIKVVKK